MNQKKFFNPKPAADQILAYAKIRGPIVLVIGDRSTEDVMTFLRYLGTRRDASISHYRTPADLIEEIDDDSHPGAMCYWDSVCPIDIEAQKKLTLLYANPVKRHFAPPLFVIVSKESPIDEHASEHHLIPALLETIGRRIVDIAPELPAYERLTRIFRAAILRLGKKTKHTCEVEPNAAAMLEDALRNGATENVDVLLQLARDCHQCARELRTDRISADLLHEQMPPAFRSRLSAPPMPLLQ